MGQKVEIDVGLYNKPAEPFSKMSHHKSCCHVGAVDHGLGGARAGVCFSGGEKRRWPASRGCAGRVAGPERLLNLAVQGIRNTTTPANYGVDDPTASPFGNDQRLKKTCESSCFLEYRQQTRDSFRNPVKLLLSFLAPRILGSSRNSLRKLDQLG